MLSLATWPSGKARLCKSLTTGSNPVVASNAGILYNGNIRFCLSEPLMRPNDRPPPPDEQPKPRLKPPVSGPTLNYSLSTVCPACNAPTFRLACKVRCGKCGFVWDCSEL